MIAQGVFFQVFDLVSILDFFSRKELEQVSQ
jgi:hypothetical protein